jgi:hypothetical protein
MFPSSKTLDATFLAFAGGADSGSDLGFDGGGAAAAGASSSGVSVERIFRAALLPALA